eukprot:12007892-Ditylum_brightwellii.AAC.1
MRSPIAKPPPEPPPLLYTTSSPSPSHTTLQTLITHPINHPGSTAKEKQRVQHKFGLNNGWKC